MKDHEPVLQIVHISDMHLTDPEFKPMVSETFLKRLLTKFDVFKPALPNSMKQRWEAIFDRAQRMKVILEDGFWGHEPKAVKIMAKDIARHALDDRKLWKGVPIWLIDSGDQSTWGDDLSLDMGLSLIQQSAKALNSKYYTRIHGNHDTWPTQFPLGGTKAKRNQHRSKLRTQHFKDDYPSIDDFYVPIPGTSSRISLSRLNSAVHTRKTNALARGYIREDKYWEQRSRPRINHQLDRLYEIADRNNSNRTYDLRIVLSHHPINARFINTKAGRHGKAIELNNAKAIARGLSTPRSSLGGEPLAHLILSGHTHAVYPPIGELEDYQAQEQKLKRPVQLVAGTTAHLDMVGEADCSAGNTDDLLDELLLDDPSDNGHIDSKLQKKEEVDKVYKHQFQILRFWKPCKLKPADKPYLVLERLVFGRRNGAGNFEQLQNILHITTTTPEKIKIYY